ncbi:MAG TPA: hypothetical protein VN228_17220 [Pyrinomonadaceae bacterium]|nr:hypothetical protein [Pyrinomonadaceae bacterium]
MNKFLKVIAGVLAAFVCLSALHLWLNVGYVPFAGAFGGEEDESFRVGFLPVT